MSLISPRLSLIRSAVQAGERRFMRPEVEHKVMPGGWGAFHTQGPRRPSYGATPPERLRLFFRLVNRQEDKPVFTPEQTFADLGAGMGMATFTAAEVFSHATGFEIDPRLCAAAENIRQQFALANVDFRPHDFMNEDLSGFSILYIYHPFLERMAETLGEKLAELPKGPLVVAKDFNSPALFSPRRFHQVYPPLVARPVLDLIMLDICAHVKC